MRLHQDLSIVEQAVLALSIILIGLLLIDPFILERSKALTPEAVWFFRTVTDIGTSGWMLIPAGAAIALALVLRRLHLGFRSGRRRRRGLPCRQSDQEYSRPGQTQAVRFGWPARFQPGCLHARLRLVPVRPRHQHFCLGHGDRHPVAAGARAALRGGSLDRAHKTPDRRALFYGRRGGCDPLRAPRTRRWLGWPKALRTEPGGLGARLLGKR